MKTAAVIISGAPTGDNLREVEIQPGTNAGDVLRALNLPGYLLSKEGSAQAYAAEEDLYGSITNGDKLRATPVAEVGDFGEWLLARLGMIPPPDAIVTVRRKSRVSTTRVVALARPVGTRHVRVERDHRPLWEVRGWRREGERLVGAFRTPRGSFAGEVTLRRNSNPDFYITNPPDGLLKGSHAACFRSRGKGRYFVHFGVPNTDIDAGIVAIEKLISRTLSGKR